MSGALNEARDDIHRSSSPATSPATALIELLNSPVRHRPTFARLASVFDGNQLSYDAVKSNEDDITDAVPEHTDGARVGLGISIAPSSQLSNHASSTSLTGLQDNQKPSPHSAAYSETHDGSETAYSPYWSPPHLGKRSVSSFQSSLHQSITPSDTRLLRDQQSATNFQRVADNEFAPSSASCPTQKNFHHGRASCLPVMILILSVYSTAFSLAYVAIASIGPFYGRSIRTGGSLSAATAGLWTAFFAKTIELSFATVFVTFLGQVLWRRASMKSQSRGVTLAEMDMRSWVMQPGTMLTHFEALRSSILSFLGLTSLLAAICTTLYTTASEALVQPSLRFTPWENKLMQGLVKTTFSNALYLADQCQTPIPVLSDPTYGGSTCMSVQYAAQGYFNYQRYLAGWTSVARNGNGTTDLTTRPQGFALLYENTTVTADWIEVVDTETVSNENARIINNVTLAMPHAGIASAARDGSNGILQPGDLDGLGIYSLHASVPSPAVNVLCANLNATELAPIVYTAWHNDTEFDPALWPSVLGFYGPGQYLNTTVVDDVFNWGQRYEQQAPVFPKYPMDYNTVLNDTGAYGREAIYLLGKGGPESADNYFVCSIKAFQTPYCSTRYNASSAGSTLEAICEDETDKLQYINSLFNASHGNATISKDWVEMSSLWAASLSLGQGINDANASSSRLLTQLALTSAELSPALPSPAEALAVMAGCTLLLGSQDTAFVEFWNYSAPSITGQYQHFNASLRAQQYASGGQADYHKGFMVILLSVFVINVVCLVYFLSHGGMVTDFSEPVNLFSLAVNSPPSDVMAGSCGGGPQGKQYEVGWYINAVGDHLVMENKASTSEEGHEMSLPKRTLSRWSTLSDRLMRR